MPNRESHPSPWIAIIISILAFFAGGGWVQFYLAAESKQQEQNIRLINDYLAPMKVLLADNLIIKNKRDKY